MKKLLKRAGSFAVACAMLILNAPRITIARAEGELPSIPKTIFALPDDLDTTWSKSENGTLANPGGTNQYIYYGKYPQSEIIDVTGLIVNVDYAKVNVEGTDKYFKIEPIKWRILSTEDGKLFLMSDKLLDAKAYNSTNQSEINWSNCDLRTWLNGDFLNTAFTGVEQGKIANTTVSAPYATTPDWLNFTWDTNIEALTGQKIFLLSGDYSDNNQDDNELRNTDYGFAAGAHSSPTRQFAVTPFAEANGAYRDNGYGAPWARSSGWGSISEDAYAFYAHHDGSLHDYNVDSTDLSVAPALKIPLTSVLFSSAAQGAASTSAEGGEFSEISSSETPVSDAPAMALRFNRDGTDLANTSVTTAGNVITYENAPLSGSNLVVVATNSTGTSYQYSQKVTGNGDVDLSSIDGFTEGMAYQAWVEKESDGVRYASNSAVENTATTEHNITYKNYDGSDIENLPENYPTTYTEGEDLILPTDSPDSSMSRWDFLGFWDCPLDKSKNVTIPGPGYEDEQTLDLTIGNKITEISAQTTGDITLYARYTSDVFDEDVNGRENYIFGAPGVFPNDSTATMRVLESGTEEYQNTLQSVDDKDVDNIKIVEFQVLNSQGAIVQPKTFFGDAVIGFKIPEGFNTDDISLIRVVANGEDITLRSRIWTDPDNSDLKYIEGTTNHFSPYAILSPWNESIVATGDNMWILITGISAVLLVSAGIFVWMNRKKKSKNV